MADIFISHSGQDNEVAAAIGKRIRHDRPTWSLFYDKDNIRAGQRWQERLREEIAVIVAIAAVAVTQVGPEAKGLALDEIAPPTA